MEKFVLHSPILLLTLTCLTLTQAQYYDVFQGLEQLFQPFQQPPGYIYNDNDRFTGANRQTYRHENKKKGETQDRYTKKPPLHQYEYVFATTTPKTTRKTTKSYSSHTNSKPTNIRKINADIVFKDVDALTLETTTRRNRVTPNNRVRPTTVRPINKATTENLFERGLFDNSYNRPVPEMKHRNLNTDIIFRDDDDDSLSIQTTTKRNIVTYRPRTTTVKPVNNVYNTNQGTINRDYERRMYDNIGLNDYNKPVTENTYESNYRKDTTETQANIQGNNQNNRRTDSINNQHRVTTNNWNSNNRNINNNNNPHNDPNNSENSDVPKNTRNPNVYGISPQIRSIHNNRNNHFGPITSDFINTGTPNRENNFDNNNGSPNRQNNNFGNNNGSPTRENNFGNNNGSPNRQNNNFGNNYDSPTRENNFGNNNGSPTRDNNFGSNNGSPNRENNFGINNASPNRQNNNFGNNNGSPNRENNDFGNNNGSPNRVNNNFSTNNGSPNTETNNFGNNNNYNPPNNFNNFNNNRGVINTDYEHESNEKMYNPYPNHPGVKPLPVDVNKPPITNRPVTQRPYDEGFKEITERPDVTPEILIGPDENDMTEGQKRRYIDMAERMCENYKSLNFKEIVALPLLPDPEPDDPVQVKVSSCVPITAPLVIGGKVASINEFPHMALVGWKKLRGNGYSWKCGGSLISDQYVLTAGHCTYQDKDYDVESGPPQAVQLGSSYLNDSNALIVKISAVIRHPKYKQRRSYYDVALIKLVQTVKFSEVVRPACLGVPPPTGRKIIATGWGRTEFGDHSLELRSVSLPVWNIDECREVWGTSLKLPNGPMADNQVCAGDKAGGRDTCQGDSGGPAQIQDGCVWRIVAVTSYGRSCAAPNTPALYAITQRAFIAAQVFGEDQDQGYGNQERPPFDTRREPVSYDRQTEYSSVRNPIYGGNSYRRQ